MLASNPCRPSASLRNLFNIIKRRSIQKQDSRYRSVHLEQHFNNEGQDIAVVLSRAEDDDIFALNRHQRLEM